MARHATINVEKLERAISRTPAKMKKHSTKALAQIKDDWVADARDIAPLDTGNLRRQIHGKSDKRKIVVFGSAKNNSFDYGLYLHEYDNHSWLKTPGTKHKFLDESIDEKEVAVTITNAVIDALKEAGWGDVARRNHDD